jgi:precorrin-6A/cobalt-precorrin-6A reductase
MILILGGTADARALAAAAHERGLAVTTSLAGRVSNPRLPPGEVRTGGFGGPAGLAGWLRRRRVDAVIDATHPFAARISRSAAEACAATGVPLLRLERPPWPQRPGDRWTRVRDLMQAAALLQARAAAAGPGGEPLRVLLTTGRQGLAAFAGLERCWLLIRCVEPPSPPLPPRHQLLLDRGPYTLAGELALLDRHRIELLVAKDSGGEMTQPKLDAARARGIEVILVERPPRPPAPSVATVDQALAWALAAAGRNP